MLQDLVFQWPVQQSTSSYSHHSEVLAGNDPTQTVVSSLLLEQLMNAVGARVRQELRTQ